MMASAIGLLDRELVCEMSLHELLALADVLDVQTLPAVLRVDEPCDDDCGAASLRARGRTSLTERGIIDGDGYTDVRVRRAMEAVAAPDWLIEMRRIDVTNVLRLCIVGDGDSRYSCVRDGDTFLLREVSAATDYDLVRNQCVPLLGSADPVSLPSLRFPSDDCDAALAGCVDSMDHAEAFFTLGVGADDAQRLARILVESVGHTEIVVNNRSMDHRTVVAIFDSAHGRIISVAAPSPSGERWTSVLPGDDSACASALRRISENLPGGIR